MTTSDRPGDRTRTVELPEPTAAAIAERIDGTEFESVDDYVAFALDQLLDELDSGGGAADRATTDLGDADDALEDRLESLGYL